jgi:hypothetical protein
MWIAILVLGTVGGNISAGAHANPFETKEACEAFAKEREPIVRDNEITVGYAMKCVEIVKADIKPGGKAG